MSDALPDPVMTAFKRRLDPADPEARLVLADLGEVCHVGKTTHVAGDPHATAVNEGKRIVFLYIAGRIGLPLAGS